MGKADQHPAPDEIEAMRQALEAETQARIEIRRQLDQAGAEFEEFISLTAHNLRESLREVAACSQLLAESYAGSLDSKAGGLLDRIRARTAGAQSLLTDVVDYWASGDGDRQLSGTDMEAVLRQALLSMDEYIVGRSAIVTHDPLPPVTGDFEILTKVLRHLIGNAVEYCGGPSPRVHISSTRADRDWVFSVKDNGLGIDPAFQSRLFGAFKRLHGNEHPGTGLGLAFCKKAIEWHGGRMWMESAPGAGSTFFFTLPPADS
ncbi:MAG: ATP-binding protein [Bryobacteraceae bacterium]